MEFAEESGAVPDTVLSVDESPARLSELCSICRVSDSANSLALLLALETETSPLPRALSNFSAKPVAWSMPLLSEYCRSGASAPSNESLSTDTDMVVNPR